MRLLGPGGFAAAEAPRAVRVRRYRGHTSFEAFAAAKNDLHGQHTRFKDLSKATDVARHKHSERESLFANTLRKAYFEHKVAAILRAHAPHEIADFDASLDTNAKLREVRACLCCSCDRAAEARRAGGRGAQRPVQFKPASKQASKARWRGRASQRPVQIKPASKQGVAAVPGAQRPVQFKPASKQGPLAGAGVAAAGTDQASKQARRGGGAGGAAAGTVQASKQARLRLKF